ncbi:AAA family ATPase [Nocardia sp. NPDC001965]
MSATLKTRRPTGVVPWPLILVEGGEKCGKSWAMAELTADERIGRAFWLDLSEGAADEYAAVPGADYEVVDHDGTWGDIVGQVAAVCEEAARAAAAGEPPVALLVDSMTAEWEMLKKWVHERARKSPSGQKILAKDPDAEIKPAMNLWNDAADRHNRLMRMLMSFPGVVVMTARGKEVAALDASGRPIPNEKDYKVEGHKALAFDASAWVRLSRDVAPRIIGARSVRHGIRPGVDKPKPAPNFSLAWMIFDVLGCDPNTANVRDLRALDSTPDPAPEPPAGGAPVSNVADRARGIVASGASRRGPAPDAVARRAAELRQQTADANDRAALQNIWKLAGELPDAECDAIRAKVEAKVATLPAASDAA